MSTLRPSVSPWIALSKSLAAALLLLTCLSVAQSAMAQTVPVPPAPAGSEASLVQGNWFWAGRQILDLLIPALFVFAGFSAPLRRAATTLARGNRYGTLTVTAVLFLFVNAGLLLPYDAWRAIARGQTTTPLQAGWWIGEGVSLLLRCAAAALFAWIPYWLIARSPRRWWLYAAMVSIPMGFFVLVALPVWVDPLTTSYQPLTDKALYADIEAMAARCGVSHIPVFVGGNDTTVVGLGPTNRIILGEDMLREEKLDELRFTVGHELKHYIMGDNYKSLAIIFGVMLLGFLATHTVGRVLIARFHGRFGFDELSDPASFPLGIFILTLTWLCVLPVFNWFGRHVEFEADRFGLELTHENHGMAQMESDYIAHGDVPDWGTFFRIFRATHPTDGERIRFANQYRPWEKGEPLAYGDICSQAP